MTGLAKISDTLSIGRQVIAARSAPILVKLSQTSSVLGNAGVHQRQLRRREEFEQHGGSPGAGLNTRRAPATRRSGRQTPKFDWAVRRTRRGGEYQNTELLIGAYRFSLPAACGYAARSSSRNRHRSDSCQRSLRSPAPGPANPCSAGNARKHIPDENGARASASWIWCRDHRSSPNILLLAHELCRTKAPLVRTRRSDIDQRSRRAVFLAWWLSRHRALGLFCVSVANGLDARSAC